MEVGCADEAEGFVLGGGAGLRCGLVECLHSHVLRVSHRTLVAVVRAARVVLRCGRSRLLADNRDIAVCHHSVITSFEVLSALC